MFFFQILISFVLLTGIFSPLTAKEGVVKKYSKPVYLFVQSAQAGSYNGKTLTLHNVSHSTVYFSDRPHRITGHILTSHFVEKWDQGKHSFKKSHPNADLSIFKGQGIDNVVVELTSVQLVGDNLIYGVKVLNGHLPKAFKQNSLFIDAFPTSVNGQITDSVTQ